MSLACVSPDHVRAQWSGGSYAGITKKTEYHQKAWIFWRIRPFSLFKDSNELGIRCCFRKSPGKDITESGHKGEPAGPS